MKKLSLLQSVLRRGLIAVSLSCLFAIPSFGQAANAPTQIAPGATAPTGAPAKAIGAAPANSPQHQILTTALSPQTRQTLQDAMNSAK